MFLFCIKFKFLVDLSLSNDKFKTSITYYIFFNMYSIPTYKRRTSLYDVIRNKTLAIFAKALCVIKSFHRVTETRHFAFFELP